MFLTIILVILTANFILDQTLAYLNLSHLKSTIPSALKGIYEDDKYAQSQAYTKANTKFGFITETFSFILAFVVLKMGLLGQLNDALSISYSNPIVLALVFFGILFIASDVFNIPFSLYSTFVIEEKFGFNKTTLKTFVIDKLKGYGLTAVIGSVIISILLYLTTTIGENFWIYFWAVVSVLMVGINMFYTSLILPLFNKLTPLEDGELKTAITAYSQKIDFPLDNIYVIDGSKRSNKANAFFSGIGKKKKIVLYDTLINNHSIEELVAVLAHEVGHFKRKHIITTMILAVTQVGFMLFLLSKFAFNTELSQALGAKSYAMHLNLVAFTMMYAPISSITSILMNLLSRKNEFEADDYASETYSSKALQVALKKLSVNNLSNLTPHPAVVFVSYSHPPMLARLKNLEKHKS
jgi:STE24 endopeptidase